MKNADATIVKSAVKVRPILFSSPMVRAILSGAKTQTRRIVKPQPPPEEIVAGVGVYHPIAVARDGEEYPGPEVFGCWNHDGDWAVKCPYGAPGDRLWVREAWTPMNTFDPEEGYLYRADMRMDEAQVDWKWKPSIHMPRRASRITLEVTSVRVERLQDISHDDAVAEGMLDHPNLDGRESRQMFRELWDRINGDGAWRANPWVWAIAFKRVQPEASV